MADENTTPTVWGIHTRDDSLFPAQNLIAIGWFEMGDLSGLPADREAFRQKYEETYPKAKKQTVAVSSATVYRFFHEAQKGDYIVYPSKLDRQIYIGRIEGDVYYVAGQHYCSRRAVKWLKILPRTAFSQGALYEIGSALTFFRVKTYASEFLAALSKHVTADSIAQDTDETIARTADDILESTRDFILKELSRQLKGYAMEDFVANLLQAMGYRTTVSAHGGDHGIDIIAYKDELPPRIVVQVKSYDGPVTEASIQSLKGAMREGDYGLFVTISEYTRNARAYLDNTPIIRGINGTELVDLILKYYDQLDETYRRLIPLKKVYIPVAVREEDEEDA